METTLTGVPFAQQTPSSQTRTNALSSDFETFLRMLTVQMKNQDPLNPIESSDFAVQLATFSGVEQQVKTNELLAKLSDGFGSSGLSTFAEWIGKDVRTAADASFNGAPLTLYPGQAFDNGDAGFLVVRDSSGLPVARYPIQGGIEPVAWAGAGAGRNAAAERPVPFRGRGDERGSRRADRSSGTLHAGDRGADRRFWARSCYRGRRHRRGERRHGRQVTDDLTGAGTIRSRTPRRMIGADKARAVSGPGTSALRRRTDFGSPL
jgi:flagellar basal-body rod modification protein FlgD